MIWTQKRAIKPTYSSLPICVLLDLIVNDHIYWMRSKLWQTSHALMYLVYISPPGTDIPIPLWLFEFLIHSCCHVRYSAADYSAAWKRSGDRSWYILWNNIYRAALYLRLGPQITLRQLHPPISRKFSSQRFMEIVPLPYRKKIYYQNYWSSIFATSPMVDLPNLYSAHHHISVGNLMIFLCYWKNSKFAYYLIPWIDHFEVGR